jgi:molybdenum cofactor cytidylyltransferase
LREISRFARYDAAVLPALILAAGASTRMGSPKAILPDRAGRPFIVRTVATLRAAGLTELIVVTGSHHEAIAAALAEAGAEARLVRNPDPSRGQLSSIWCGLDALPESAAAVLVTLVDVPFVATTTVRAVVDAWRHSRAPIVRPIVGGRRGHPVIFDRAVFEELRQAPLEQGARLVVRAHWGDSLDVPVEDGSCLIDVDTPADYERVRNA